MSEPLALVSSGKVIGSARVLVALTAVLRPPTEKMRRVADLLDESLAAFLEARPPADPYWEALVEGRVMCSLAVRHVEGVIELSRIDQVLIAPAWAAARSAFEVGGRLIWLLEPPEPFEREARWLSRVSESARFYADLTRRVEELGGESRHLADQAREITTFRDGVEAKLPPGTQIGGIPSLDKVLIDSSGQTHYINYKLASQYVHGTHVGAEVFRHGLGTEKVFGEFISPGMWAGPMRLCWYTLAAALPVFLVRAEADLATYLPEGLASEVETALAALADEGDE